MKPPFYSGRSWLRVFSKAIVLLISFDVLFIALRPFEAIKPWSLYGRVVPYQARLAYPVGNVGDQFAPIETLLAAHEIALPKTEREFRLVILGDSGINGWGNPDTETISGFINQARIEINGKQVRAYNLAYIGPSATRDLLVADAALAYQPDLIVWFVGLQGFDNSQTYPMINYNKARMSRLTTRFGLDDINARAYGHFTDEWWQHSIFAERAAIYQWLRFQASALLRPNLIQATGITAYESIPAFPVLKADDPRYTPLPNATWTNLLALRELTDIPVLFINEPILVVPGSAVNYDAWYSRELYDLYRDTFNNFCQQHQLWCQDIWNVLPETDFSDTPLHHTANGNQKIVVYVVRQIQDKLSWLQEF